jgi:hypothetical protein
MRIFLAGKIARSDWRHEIVDGLDAMLETGNFDIGWPVMEDAIYGKHDYTGPYFREIQKMLPEQKVHRLCLQAIGRSELVYCWWDDDTAFASLIELGYATALAIPYIIAYPKGYDKREMWFASCCAKVFLEAPGPVTGLKTGLMRYSLLYTGGQGASTSPESRQENSPQAGGSAQGRSEECASDAAWGDDGRTPSGSAQTGG